MHGEEIAFDESFIPTGDVFADISGTRTLIQVGQFADNGAAVLILDHTRCISIGANELPDLIEALKGVQTMAKGTHPRPILEEDAM